MKTLLISNDKKLFTETGSDFEDLCNALEQENVEEIHVIVHTRKKDNLEIKKISREGHGALFLYPTNSLFPLAYAWDTFKLARNQLTFKFHLAVDLISAETSIATAISARVISWKYGKNYIMHLRQGYEEMMERNNVAVKAFKKDLLNYLFSHAAGIRAASQSIGEELYDLRPDLASRIYILPFVSDVDKIRKSWTTKDIHDKYKQFNIILLLAGRKIARKTVKRAKKIMEALRMRYPRIGLVVMGSLKSRFFRLTKHFGRPEYIVYAKREQDMTTLYRTANIFIDTSISTDPKEQNPELVNAALAGAPIVSSKNNTSQGIITDGENGLIADPDNTLLFARKVIEILEINGLREQMRFAKFNITEIYGASIDGYAERLVSIWDACKSESEANAHIDKLAVPLAPKKAAKSKAVTMLAAERVKREAAKAMPSYLNANPREGEKAYTLDLDKIKLSLEEAMQEAEKAPEKTPIPEGEVLDLDDIEDMNPEDGTILQKQQDVKGN